MDQRRDGVELLGDSAQYGLKHMLPECFVSVKLETYEEGSCSDLQQYPVAQSTSPENSSRTGFITARAAPPTEDSSCSQPNSVIIYLYFKSLVLLSIYLIHLSSRGQNMTLFI